MIYMDHKNSVQLNKLKKHFIFCPVLQAVSQSRRSLRFSHYFGQRGGGACLKLSERC